MKKRIEEILACMRAGTFERDGVLGLSLLSALAGESIFLLGLPGVGKSMVARRLKLAFEDATIFEYLMSRFSTPDEIFGPVSISKLKDEDCYERVTSGYLPTAEIVFLDEIWKAGPAIQNSLLTVLNEKIYLNGNVEIHLPLKGVIAASNELPAEGEGLEALWDRFLLRYIVEPIGEKKNFFRLLEGEGVSAVQTASYRPITDKEYADWKAGSRAIKLPKVVLEAIYMVRSKLILKSEAKDSVMGERNPEGARFYVSDRRWKKAVGVMRMSAYLNGRREVDLSDMLLLMHIIWNDDGSIPEVRRILSEGIVSALFYSELGHLKSNKRHVKADSGSMPVFYSPDNSYYIINCDGDPMKIAIKDYEQIRAEPNSAFFGSETIDGTLVVRPRGQMSIRFVREGVIGINGYNYNLQTETDREISAGAVADIKESIDTLVDGLYKSVRENIFVRNSPEMLKEIQAAVLISRRRAMK